MNCDKCSTELKKEFPDRMRRRDDYPQYSDALIIDLHGGYGMYLDPFPPENTRTILCGSCAAVFLGQNAFIKDGTDGWKDRPEVAFGGTHS